MSFFFKLLFLIVCVSLHGYRYRCLCQNVAQDMCLTWVMWSSLRSKVTRGSSRHSSTLWSWLSSMCCIWVWVTVCLCMHVCVCVCVCVCTLDFLLHIRLQKKRTTAWHGHHGCPYPTHQPACERFLPLAEQQALAETSITLLLLTRLPYTLTVLESTQESPCWQIYRF